MSSPADAVANAHRPVLPVAVHDGLIVQRAAHIARVLPSVDVDHISAAAPAATRVIRAVDGLVPAPAGVEELGGDVPVADCRTATEVAGDAVDPVARARQVHAVLRRSVVRVAEGAPIRRARR